METPPEKKIILEDITKLSPEQLARRREEALTRKTEREKENQEAKNLLERYEKELAGLEKEQVVGEGATGTAENAGEVKYEEPARGERHEEEIREEIHASIEDREKEEERSSTDESRPQPPSADRNNTTEQGVISPKPPGFWRRNWLRFALAAGLISGGGYGGYVIQKTGKENDLLKKQLLEKAEAAKKATDVFTLPPDTTNAEILEAAKKLKEGQEKAIKQIEAVKAETARLTKEMALIGAPIPQTHEERIQYLLHKPKLTSAEKDELNRDLPRRAAESRARNRKAMEEAAGPRPQPVFQDLSYRGPLGGQVGNVPAPSGPVQNLSYTPPTGAPHGVGMNMMNNPLGLSPEMMQKVMQTYTHNIRKTFPRDTEKKWSKVKDESAYELVNKVEKKVRKAEKPLFECLQKFKQVTGLEPLIGETIEQYMVRALQDAASKNVLQKME